MIVSFIYVIFAILGLSFLIFIHELGHYWMARIRSKQGRLQDAAEYQDRTGLLEPILSHLGLS